MAQVERKSIVPQFSVKMSECGPGTTVRFNGQDVRNVCAVSVSNDRRVDDVVRSTITIELVGETVSVDATDDKPLLPPS
jgi:hypothetical protein